MFPRAKEMHRNKVSPKTRKSALRVEDSLRPIACLNSLLGMTVFETPSGQAWPKLSILYSLLRSGVYGFFVYCSIVYYPREDEVLPILGAVYVIILFVNLVIIAVSTVLGFVNFKKTKKFYKSITLIDETLQYYGIEPDYESTHRRNVRIVIGWSTIAILVFVSDLVMFTYVYGNVGEGVVKTFALEVPMILNPTVELNFVIKVATLGKRFQRLNSLIESVAIDSLQTTNSSMTNQNGLASSSSQSSVRPRYNFKNRDNIELVLKTVRQLHLDLCATSRKANATCSKQMSMQMAASFLMLIGFTYCFYLIHNEPRIALPVKIHHYRSLGTWILVNIFRMIYVVRTSVNVTTEAQKTSQIAHEIQVPKSQIKLVDEIHQLSLQIMQHPLTFTASGMIVLDFGYVRGFVGSVTTYLMILIQNQPDMIKAANTLAEVSSYENSTDVAVA